MRRREFLGVLGGGAAAWPLAARAQRSERVRRVGVLLPASEDDPEYQAFLGAFREELRKLGWAEGINIRIDIHWASGGAAAMQRFANELVMRQPDLILTQGTPATASAQQQTRSIPIVFASVVDPIGSGFVASFARPRGNVTGFTVMEAATAGKWLELLKEIAPRIAQVGFLFHPTTAPYAEYYLKPFRTAAGALAVRSSSASIRDASELESVIRTLGRDSNGGLVVMPDHYLNVHRAEIISLAARYHVPAVYPYRFYAELGGLLSYGSDYVDNWRRAAIYADKILKGEKPAELPVQAPVKYDLVINLKTAKSLGLDVPLILQQRADEVIE